MYSQFRLSFVVYSIIITVNTGVQILRIGHREKITLCWPVHQNSWKRLSPVEKRMNALRRVVSVSVSRSAPSRMTAVDSGQLNSSPDVDVSETDRKRSICSFRRSVDTIHTSHTDPEHIRQSYSVIVDNRLCPAVQPTTSTWSLSLCKIWLESFRMSGLFFYTGSGETGASNTSESVFTVEPNQVVVKIAAYAEVSCAILACNYFGARRP